MQGFWVVALPEASCDAGCAPAPSSDSSSSPMPPRSLLARHRRGAASAASPAAASALATGSSTIASGGVAASGPSVPVRPPAPSPLLICFSVPSDSFGGFLMSVSRSCCVMCAASLSPRPTSPGCGAFANPGSLRRGTSVTLAAWRDRAVFHLPFRLGANAARRH